MFPFRFTFEPETHYLTSTAIATSRDGEYEFQDKALLVPHEALRREMFRLVTAASRFDPWIHPWKAHCMHQWVTEFFVPIVHEHHDIEEQIMFPCYRDQGAAFPDKQAADHVTLMAMLAELEGLAQQTLNLVESPEQSGVVDVRKLRETAELLTKSVEVLNKAFLDHLIEEETYWPPIIKQYGPEVLENMEKRIFKEAAKSPSFPMMGCAVFNAMGTSFGGIPAVRSDDYPPWPSEDLRLDIATNVFFPVRKFLFPSWEKKYNNYKTMIGSINGSIDVLNIRDPMPENCACAVM